MFSGIVDHCGSIAKIEHPPQGLRVLIDCAFTDLQEGESVAVDGCCLTVVEPQAKHFYCDISPETLRLTTAAKFSIGRKVNLERALCVGDRIGGHCVTGHVDQCGKIKNIREQHEYVEMEIEGVSPENMAYILQKGSIAINGVSLTINEVLSASFKVMLIPHTLARTNLSQLNIGDTVNLEFDSITRTVINYLRQLPLNLSQQEIHKLTHTHE